MSKILTGLEKDLNILDTLARSAKLKMTINKELRTTKFLNDHFGISEFPGPPYKKIEAKEIGEMLETLVNELKEKVKRRYEEKAAEPTESAKEVQDKVRERQVLDIYNDGRIQRVDKEEDNKDENRKEESIFNPKFPDQKATLTTQHSHGCEQVLTAKQLFDDLHYKHMPGQYTFAMAGAGKTYILGSVIKNFINAGYLDNVLAPWPILYVTKVSVVEQTRGVLEEFGLDTTNTVIVINIEQLRSKLKETLIREDIKYVNGEPKEFYYWNKVFRPALIVWDEAQVLARAENSSQAKIAASIHDETDPLYTTYEIFASATPGSKISEFKCFAVSTGKMISTGIGEVRLSNENWTEYANRVAAPGKPTELNQAAVGRFINEFEPYIKRVKNIRPRHKAFNSVKTLTFQTAEESEEYHKALENHQRRKAKIESNAAMSAQQVNMALLAEFTIFCRAAENCRRFHLAKWAHECWYNAGRAPSIGFRFKQTASNVIRILMDDYNWKREDISIIWGGATEALSTKKKLAAKIKKGGDKFMAELEELGIDIEEDMGIDLTSFTAKTDEQLAFEKKHGLLTQKPADRERERLNFQSQRSKLCLFSYKSGGVGLSLHHEDKYPNARQREGIFTPVYSEKELVQALGRLPRLTSATDTYQSMAYYTGTIEDHVAAVVKAKLRCLREVIRTREDWSTIVSGNIIKDYAKYTSAQDAVDEEEDNLAADAEAVDTLSEYVEEGGKK